MGGVGVQALTHGTLPWTAEGHTRTTLFCQPPVTSHPCTPLVQTLTAVDIDAAAAGSADKYMPRHEAWSREEDYFNPALVSHYPDVRIPPPQQQPSLSLWSLNLKSSSRVCAQEPSRHLLRSLMWLVSFLA